MWIELLTSYWWIILLILIVVIIITKNIIKALITLVVLVVLLFVFDYLFVSPAAGELTECITTYAKETDESVENFMKYSAGAERRDYVCTSGETSLDEFFQCTNKVNTENGLATKIYFMIPDMKANIVGSLDLQNENCPDNQVEKPAYLN